MQLNTMDCTGRRSNNAERDSDLGDDLSHDDHTDDEMRDCDSVDGDHVIRARRLNVASNGGDMSYGSGGGVGGGGGGGGIGMGVRSPDRHTDLQMNQHHHFPPNHALNALGSFMGIGALHGIPSLQHNDVLEKLKMQVRDMKVGLMEQDYNAAHAAAFAPNLLPTPINTAFSLPPTTMASYGHSAQSLSSQTGGGGAAAMANGNPNTQNSTNAATGSATALTNGGSGGVGGGGGGGGGNSGGLASSNSGGSFSFASPTAPNTKDVNPASNSSTSSEASNSSQQNNGWSFEEQYKQVRQLYEINDDPKRKEFLDDLFSFMQKRGTPINRLPIMAKSVLDLYELYNLVIARGGLVDVINKKLWQEIIKGLHLPSSITSAAFTLRTQYMKYLYPYECDKKNLSTPAELQAAIDGNRREGRRSSYGQYEAMHSQMQIPQMARQSLPGGMQQMSPLALVTHAANNQQAQAAAAAAAAHHRLMAPTFGQMPNLVTHEFEQRMMEYLKLIQVKKEQSGVVGVGGGGAVGVGVGAGGGGVGLVTAAAHTPQQRQRSQSPEITTREAMNALEMSRVALWQMYHNNTSPPASVNASPQGVGCGGGGGGNGTAVGIAEQRSEALNLSESPPNLNHIKREREREPSPEQCDRDDFHQPPPAKRVGSGLNFPASFYLPPGMAAAAAAAAANFHHSNNAHTQDSDAEDNDEDVDTHNTTTNSSLHEETERKPLNGHHLHHHHHHHHHHGGGGGDGGGGGSGDNNNNSGQHDKSDDSAIENSPSTSGASASGGVGTAVGMGIDMGSAGGGDCHSSPVSTKKIHLAKPQTNCGGGGGGGGGGDGNREASTAGGAGGTIRVAETLSLLSGMQFRVARNGTGANGEQQLIVNLELNGIKYSGVLIASTSVSNAPTDSKTADVGLDAANSGGGGVAQKDIGDGRDDEETGAEPLAASSAESSPAKAKVGSATMANGPTGAALKDAVMTA